MEFVKQSAGGAGLCAQIFGCICSCGCLAGFITFMVYLGKYAFSNPDPLAWYVEGDNGYLTLTPPAENAEGIVDIHGEFVLWFTWMFANMCFYVVMPVFMGIGMCLMASSPMIGNIFNGLVGCGSMCSGLIVWIMGMVWRFSAAGKYASGDDVAEGVAGDALEQTSSGKFIGIYYLISWIILGTMCGCSIIGAIVACVCK